MIKPKFNKKRLEKLMQRVFQNSKITSYEKFSTGLVSPTFKVKIQNPDKTLVIKLAKTKNKHKIQQNNKILNYLNKNSIPSPRIYFEGIFDRKYITIMECVPGKVASEIYQKVKPPVRRKILKNAGRTLKQIHNLKIPSFWVHHHHEIKNEKEWKIWTKLRIDKYLKFSKRKLSLYHDYLEKDLNKFWEILKREREIKFVPLHWDYHSSNINVNTKGEITGIFDFDNAMKGHHLADLGQTAYWIRFQDKDYKNFKSFLSGYEKKFSKKELTLIRGYFLLHLLAVSRTIWFKQKRLGWIIEEHKRILDEFAKRKI